MSTPAVSPLLSIPGAVPGLPNSPDSSVAWHYGDPFREQRAASERAAVVDRSHRRVIAVTGDERLTWLHTISSQHIAALADGESAENLDLDLNGRVLHHFVLTDSDGTTWIDTEGAVERSGASRESGTEPDGDGLLEFLKKMVFWAKAAPRDADAERAVLSLLGPEAVTLVAILPADVISRPMPYGYDLLVPRDALRTTWDALVTAGAAPAGMWAFEALRVAALTPRTGMDTDDRTIPHEVGWIGRAVHLDKGCYRGQETVARVHNLGKPPRHLVLLHLDGSADGRPTPGDDVTAGGRTVGRVGTVVDHYELGPIALALVKRTVPVDTPLTAGPSAAAIDPDSMPSHEEPQAGRQAVERLRGRA